LHIEEIDKSQMSVSEILLGMTPCEIPETHNINVASFEKLYETEVYTADFTGVTPLHENWNPVNALWKISDGEMQIVTVCSTKEQCAIMNRQWKNFDMSFKMKF